MTDFPEDVVKQIARALAKCPASETALDLSDSIDRANALTALSALPPAAQAVLKGEAVAVPKDATTNMLVAGENSEWGWRDERGIATSGRINCQTIWRAMLAASPYAREPQQCSECGQNPADSPSRLCVGCEAYKEHQR